MVDRRDEVLYVTGWEVSGVVDFKQKQIEKNRGGDSMLKTNTKTRKGNVTEEYKVLRGTGKNEVENTTLTNKIGGDMTEEYKVLRGYRPSFKYNYKEDGETIAVGNSRLEVIGDYLENHLGYDITDINEDYEWKDYPNNTNYEVCELGLVRNKKTGELMELGFKGGYEEGNKDSWRFRLTITGEPTTWLSKVVATTFLGKQPEVEDAEGKEVEVVIGHLNDNPLDNRVENLKYITGDFNITMDWVLKDIALRGLTPKYVDDVYKQIEEVVEDKYGVTVEKIGTLTEEDIEEVREYIDVYKRVVSDIYDYKVNGTGVLSELDVVGNKFIF